MPFYQFVRRPVGGSSRHRARRRRQPHFGGHYLRFLLLFHEFRAHIRKNATIQRISVLEMRTRCTLENPEHIAWIFCCCSHWMLRFRARATHRTVNWRKHSWHSLRMQFMQSSAQQRLDVNSDKWASDYAKCGQAGNRYCSRQRQIRRMIWRLWLSFAKFYSFSIRFFFLFNCTFELISVQRAALILCHYSIRIGDWTQQRNVLMEFLCQQKWNTHTHTPLIQLDSHIHNWKIDDSNDLNTIFMIIKMKTLFES